MADKIIQTFVTGSKPDFDVSSGAYETVDLNKELTVNLQNLGEENVPDFGLFKYSEDSSKVSEAVNKYISKNVSDTANFNEILSLVSQFDRPFGDQSNVSDPISREWAAQRSFEESSYFASSYVEYDYVKNTPGAIDIIYNSVNKVVNETLLMTEIVAKAIELTLIESLSIIENFQSATTYTISFLEQSIATDSSQNSQGFGRQLPIGFFASDYVDLAYAAESPGSDRINVREVVTTTLGT